MSDDPQWGQQDPALVIQLDRHRQGMLGAYRADPDLVQEHANQEDSFRTGGYADRQLLELVQNAADAQYRSGHRGRVELRLVGDTLYCANQGEPFTQAGLRAVCHAFLSDKRNEEIGRFGLGFKSVLAVSARPAVFSRSISFDFGGDRDHQDLRAIAPDAQRLPVLRLPAPVDVVKEMGRDPVLRELATWAQTVIRLPLSSAADRLRADLETFPVEFLLFVPGIAELRTSVDRSGNKPFDATHRCVEGTPGVLGLQSGDDAALVEWHVWHRFVEPSAAALLEVGEAIRRNRVRVSWAAPLTQATTDLGRFWAYFPLSDVTSLRGIVNAPWRVNDDRTNLLPGLFNRELLAAAAQLVVEGLPHLSDPDDPARHFDYLPARGNEAPNHADRYLTTHIPLLASRRAVVPDADGRLRALAGLYVVNPDEVRPDQAMLQAYHAAPGRPVAVPHLSCYRNQTRQSRLRYLLRADDEAVHEELGAAAWLELLVSDGTDEQCEAALRVVDATIDVATRDRLRAAHVLPDSGGTLRRLDAIHDVFLRGDVLSRQAGLDLVRPSLIARPDTEDLLRALGLVDVDPAQELGKLFRMIGRDWQDSHWRAFWGLVPEVSARQALQYVDDHVASGGTLKVLCRDGVWHDINTVVRAGTVEPLEPALVLDDKFHDLHTDLLAQVGVAARPTTTRAALQDPTYREYLRAVRAHYLQQLPPRGRPEAVRLDFEDDRGLGPLHVLRRFADTEDPTSRVRWSTELLEADAPTRWCFGHTNRATFPKIQAIAPHLWAVKRYGLLETAWGPRPAGQALSHELSFHAPLLPVSLSSATDRLELVGKLDDVPVIIWNEFLGRIPAACDPWQLGGLLCEAVRRLRHASPPDRIPALCGTTGCSTPPEGLLVAGNEEEVRALAARDLPYVAVIDRQARDLLGERWGCRPAASLLRVEWVTDTPGGAVVLLDRFRGLRAVDDGGLDGIDLVGCEAVFRQITGATGVDREPVDLAREANVVYYRSGLADEDLLAALSQEFALQLTTVAIQTILADAQTEQVRRRIALCRNERDPARKLLRLLDVRVLEARLPAGLLANVTRLGGRGGPEQVAQLLLHVYGDDVLHELRVDLAAAGLQVPDRWAGTAPAVAFVRELGYGTEFAGERGAALDADLTVLGPPNLSPLHDYQEKLAAQIRDLVAHPDRALLFLPTGAGKTRVTVQALATAFTHDGLRGPVLWIAQTEELCEQAVQTWSAVWRELGDGRPLRLCRLWSRNEVADSEHELTVVIATDAKLEECRDREDYAWLAEPTAVIIDEAHQAVSRTYTRTLAWLGLDARHTARPLLGLTATPFKGTGAAANETLAARFDGRKLDVLGDDPYGSLQDLGVLSRVQHRVLDGAAMSLDTRELDATRRTRLLPPAVLERLGRDEARTDRLLQDITELPADWPVLVFTSSVLSAQILAALLRVRGARAAAISGMTPTPERRRSIERFRRGEVQVLTNCNVLTQGFDAPGVRALYIARPTFSPNAYIQMVGRGLRGPANGGNDECMIVNVADTFGQFGERLAYREFDHLWKDHGDRPQ